jgi:alpha-beta hydrolase superfamily lysophospholipase
MSQEVNFSVDVDGLSVSGRLHRPTSEPNGKVPPAVLLCRALLDTSEAEGDLIAAIEHGLVAAGIAVATFDPRIRRCEPEEGQEPPPSPDPVHCAAAVFDWLTRRVDLDGLRLSVLGHSVGAIVAAGLAHRVDKVHRMCLVSPASPDRLAAQLTPRNGTTSDASAALNRHLQPLTTVPVSEPLTTHQRQTLIILGATDRALQPESAREYERIAAKAPRNIELVLVPFADAAFATTTVRQVCVERIVDFFSARAPAETVVG